jgi:hypothetical protein
MIGTDDRYKHFAKDWFRAGLKAQRLLKQQAIDHGLMIEDLSQDVESFKGYTTNANVPIKRGDFLIRNARNIEIETKCFTFYRNGNEDCFYIEYADVKKHHNMEKFTGCPVILAVYKRRGDTPEEDSLCMIGIQTIVDENNKRVKYDQDKKCFIVPVSLTKPNFTLIDQVRAEISIKIDNLESSATTAMITKTDTL